MLETTVQKLGEFGQSVWLDNISRSMIESGRLARMIARGLRGMTSNPTIFDKAISRSCDYDEEIMELVQAGKSIFEIYDDLTIDDVLGAADLFMPVYDRTRGLDGWVSLETNPKLAYKTQETIEEVKRLHQKVNRPNVMFKVPAPEEGFLAIEELLSEGININITLIFSLTQYVNTAQAFIRGMKRLLEKQGNLSGVHSVASVFVSRIDTAVDSMIDELLANEKDEGRKDMLGSLKGRAAVANASLLFQKYIELFSAKEFSLLKEKGANFQRLLWGSTSTKNPAYSDIKYVTDLIAKNTVNTMPQNTFKAFLDHGVIRESLPSDVEQAQNIIKGLKSFGIDLNNVCAKLLDEGVVAFEKSFDSLLDSIESKTNSLCER